VLLLVALAHLYRGVFPFCIIWSLYPAIFGQATPSAFGRVRLALTINDFEYSAPDVRSDTITHMRVRSTLAGQKQIYFILQKYDDGKYYFMD